MLWGTEGGIEHLKRLYKTKKSRFSSLLSLAFLAGMMLIFLVGLPEFLSIAAGRIFAVIWAVMAIFVFTAHAREMSAKPEVLKSPFGIASFEKGDIRTKNNFEKHIYKGLG
jgi:hypothetical protein